MKNSFAKSTYLLQFIRNFLTRFVILGSKSIHSSRLILSSAANSKKTLNQKVEMREPDWDVPNEL